MKLSTGTKIVVALASASFLGSALAYLFGAPEIGKVVVLPALILSGWAFVGHLVTLDDDMPGEWSNPAGERKVWLASLSELLVKLAVFGAALSLFLVQS